MLSKLMSAPNIRFGLWCLGKIATAQPKTCPFCDGRDTVALGREKLLLQMRECRDCGLRFRYPKDTPTSAVAYYEGDYEAGEKGDKTSTPSPAELARLRETAYRGTDLDFSEKVAFVRRYGGDRLFDYGCSWGYTLDQFRAAGCTVAGFELDRRRAAYGRQNLDVEIYSNAADAMNLPAGSFDTIFTNHCLEHVHDLRPVLGLFDRLLSPDGTLVIVVPNGSGPVAKRMGAGMVSREHVASLTADFFARNLPAWGFQPRFMTEPYSGEPQDYRQGDDSTLVGKELVVVVRRAAA